MLRVLERNASAACNGAQRVFRDVEGDVDLLGETLGDAPQQGAAAGQE